MKKRKYLSLIIGILFVVMAGAASSAYGEVVSVPVNMNVEPVSIDFQITESINMTAASGQNALEIDKLVITNNETEGYDLVVHDITVLPYEDWKLVTGTEDFSMKINEKVFSILTEGHDFASGSYTGVGTITPGTTTELAFTGQTSLFTETVSEKAADIIVTIDFEKKKIINFTVDEKSYQAEEGMTWRQWIASGYNTDGFKITSGGVLGRFWVGDPNAYTKEEAAAINFKVDVNPDSAIKPGNAYFTHCCFVAGTQVQTTLDDQTKSIEKMKKGDTVVSYDVETGKYYVAEVEGLVIHPDTTTMAEVHFENGETLVMNEYHPVLTDEGFKSLTNFSGFDTLETGDMARTSDGFTRVTEILQYKSEPVDTYTLAIRNIGEIPDNDQNDTYIANGIVVHNVSCWYTWY